jgi:cation diffusion facilitator family transporter
LLINSSTLFLDAVASLMDVVSSILLIICIKLAQRPPDQNHPFGHGRYEPLGGLLLGLFFIILGGVMFSQQILGTIQHPNDVKIAPTGWLFAAVAMVVLEFAYRRMMKIAKREESPALAAEAIHYRIDSLTSLLATLALLTAAFIPDWSHLVDHLGAIAISLFMIIIGLFAARDNFHQLMDKIPSKEYFCRVRNAAKGVQGVEGTEKINIQQYGPDAHVDIDIEVNPRLSVDKAHQISQRVRVEIQKAWPAVRDVTVHIEPYYANDH